jgi:hypothetical protein
MLDTVKMKHRTIVIPILTPTDRILEAAHHLDTFRKQNPRRAQRKEIKAIELLRKVLLGKKEKESNE